MSAIYDSYIIETYEHLLLAYARISRCMTVKETEALNDLIKRGNRADEIRLLLLFVAEASDAPGNPPRRVA